MAAASAGASPTHVAYSDESHHNVGRFRSLGVVSLRREHAPAVTADLAAILRESNAREFKWQKLKNAKYRFVALKFVDYTVSKAADGTLRVDALIWDIEDSRHSLVGRDDRANLRRMYYHLFKNVLLRRWPAGSSWRLHPDEQTALDWDALETFVDAQGLSAEIERPMLASGSVRVRFRREFRVEEIVPCESTSEPITQLADLFAGLAVYSRECFDRYETWNHLSGRRPTLFPDDLPDAAALSNSDRERCLVLEKLDARCKALRLGVGLMGSRGLKTHDPRRPINFWWYEPQHDADKAPTRR